MASIAINTKIPCPCCGFRTLPAKSYGSYETCSLCGWEDDPVQLSNPCMEGGANSLSLSSSQQIFLYSEARRTAVENDAAPQHDPNWRPLTDFEIEIFSAEIEHHLLWKGVVEPSHVYWHRITYDKAVIQRIQQTLVEQSKCEMLHGLTPMELVALEHKYGLRFPPELLAFYSCGVPVNCEPSDVPKQERFSTSGWHNWHWLLRDEVQRHVWSHPDDPADADRRDTVSTQLRWHAPPDCDDSGDEWVYQEGEEKEGEETEEVAPEDQRRWKDEKRRAALKQYPLVPVFSHRMMPVTPFVTGLPMYSMHGNDRIYYGDSFFQWLEEEFKVALEIPETWLVPKVEKSGVKHWAAYLQ